MLAIRVYNAQFEIKIEPFDPFSGIYVFRHSKIRVLARRLASARKDREVDNAIAGVQ